MAFPLLPIQNSSTIGAGPLNKGAPTGVLSALNVAAHWKITDLIKYFYSQRSEDGTVVKHDAL